MSTLLLCCIDGFCTEHRCRVVHCRNERTYDGRAGLCVDHECIACIASPSLYAARQAAISSDVVSAVHMIIEHVVRTDECASCAMRRYRRERSHATETMTLAKSRPTLALL